MEPQPKHLITPTLHKILTWLLIDPDQAWSAVDLAKAAKISPPVARANSDRLVAWGWATSRLEEPEEAAADGRSRARRYYQLTKDGAAQAEAGLAAPMTRTSRPAKPPRPGYARLRRGRQDVEEAGETAIQVDGSRVDENWFNPDHPADLRNRVILLLSRVTGLSSPALSRMRIEDCRVHEGQVHAWTRDAADQRTEEITISDDGTPLSPAAAVTAWIEWLSSQGVEAGPLLRPLALQGSALAKGEGPLSVARIFQIVQSYPEVSDSSGK